MRCGGGFGPTVGSWATRRTASVERRRSGDWSTRWPTSTGTGCSSRGFWRRTACLWSPSPGFRCRLRSAPSWRGKGGARMVGKLRRALPPGCCRRSFGREDPALAVTLAPETRQALEKLVGELPAAVFTASDSLGWTYQFWQADRKDEVNRSGSKIGEEELPAVTQLFTENYMVRFLFHNTIGAWRAGRLLAERS